MALKKGHKGYPTELLRLLPIFKQSAQQIGLSGADADRLAFEISNHLRHNWGGRQLYFSEKNHKENSTAAFYRDVQAIASRLLREAGKTRDEAAAFTTDIQIKLEKLWAGSQLYIGTGFHFDIDRRNEYIAKELGRKSHCELAAQFGVSTRQIYSIAKQAQEQKSKMKN